MEKSEPSSVADALFEYMKYKEKSEYINRLKLKEIKKLETEKLVKTFQNSLEYETEFHYIGTKNKKTVQNTINKNLTFTDKAKKSESPIILDVEQYTENTILFVNKPKALQAKVYFMINGTEYKKEQLPEIEAFNQYFGGGFSGLVLQEIREYRSMAYSAGAWYVAPKKENASTIFYGYIGTQADKTLNAIDIFHGLVREMPEKPERMDMIKHYLEQSALTATPSFREKSSMISRWQTAGYTQDPRIDKVKEYEKLTFENLTNFYSKNIKEKPMVIAIVGDKKSIDLKSLEKYGKVIIVKEKSLFKD